MVRVLAEDGNLWNFEGCWDFLYVENMLRPVAFENERCEHAQNTLEADKEVLAINSSLL